MIFLQKVGANKYSILNINNIFQLTEWVYIVRVLYVFNFTIHRIKNQSL